MIIAILDDGGVMVHGNLADAQMHHEGIDVEDGAVAFFDLQGRRLLARFVEPNIRSVFVVASGRYELQPDRDERESLLKAVGVAAYLDPTPLAASLAQLQDDHPRQVTPNSAAAADGNRAAGAPSALLFRVRLPRLSGKTFGVTRVKR